MRRVGEVTVVGTVSAERRILDHPFFPVVERVITNTDGVREPQLLWDRAGKRFAVAVGTTTDGNFVLVEEPKYGQLRRFLSVPTGGVKKGEAPIDAAAREFLEETGYECSRWEILRRAPVVDFADKIDGGEHYFFWGIGATKISEPESDRRVVIFSLAEIKMMLRGVGTETLELAMTIAALSIAIL